MRVLFLLLLLANVLFLAWTRWVVPPMPVARETPAANQGLQPIRLRQEQPAATTSDVAASEPGLSAADCVSIGPFVDPGHAEAVRTQLERLGFTSRRRVALDDVRVGFWVRVPNLATPADANIALAALKEVGHGDAYVIADDEPGTTLSIGVYADQQMADAVSARVQTAGYTTETSDRLRKLEVLWLDIDRQANGGLPALEALEPPAEGGLPIDLRACPAPGGSADVTSPANPASLPATAAATG